MWAKESATDMFLISKWLIATGRYPAFFKEALNGRKPWPAMEHKGGRTIINDPPGSAARSIIDRGTIPAFVPAVLRPLHAQPGKVCEINMVKCS
jgi:hypothetical protein